MRELDAIEGCGAMGEYIAGHLTPVQGQRVVKESSGMLRELRGNEKAGFQVGRQSNTLKALTDNGYGAF